MTAEPLALLVGALWGASPIAQKWLQKDGVPPALTAVVCSLAFFLGSLGWYAGGGPQRTPAFSRFSCTTWIVLLLGAGCVATMVPNLLYSYLLGREDTRATVVAVFAFSAPVFTVLYNVVFLKEPLRTVEYIGVALSVLGTALLFH